MDKIYTLGIDIGSTASKCVILADGKELVSKSLIPVGAGTSGPQRAIDEVLSAAGKKREEALAMLDKFFPRLEAHLGQVKKYQATIDYLTQENDGLKEKVKDENSVKRQLEAAKLKQENEQLRQFISKIPPEMRREIQQRQTPQKGREERD
mgnify:CR=1 FL=1